MMTNAIPELTVGDFDSTLSDSARPWVVDFHAPWCGPCRILGPILEALAARYSGRIRFAKVNVDEQPDLAVRFAISGIPALLLIQDGRVVDQIVGLLPPRQLQERLDALLSDPKLATTHV